MKQKGEDIFPSLKEGEREELKNKWSNINILVLFSRYKKNLLKYGFRDIIIEPQAYIIACLLIEDFVTCLSLPHTVHVTREKLNCPPVTGMGLGQCK